MQRQFLTKIAQNTEYVQTHCNDRNNSFQFGIRKWYLYNNPHN